jgi:hypothetical protein
MELNILIAGLVGAVVYKLVNYRVSGKKNTESPLKFDWKYWLSDRGNWNDILLGGFIFIVIARYKESLFIAFPDNWLVVFLTPFKDNEFFYFVIGFLMTYILKLIRNLLWSVSTLSKLNKKD